MFSSFSSYTPSVKGVIKTLPRWKWFLGCLLLTISFFLQAQSPDISSTSSSNPSHSSVDQRGFNVGILLSGKGEAYQQIVETLRKELQPEKTGANRKKKSLALAVQYLAEIDQQSLPQTLAKQDLWVAVGARATQAIASSDVAETTPYFSTLISKDAAVFLQQRYEHPPLTSLYLDQPPARKLALIEALGFRGNRLGVMTGPNSENKLTAVKNAPNSGNFEILSEVLNEQDNPLKKIRGVMSDSDVYLVLPDKPRFNRLVAKWVVNLSYRHRVPVVAYSSKYAQAGALVSLYSSPEQIAEQAAETISAIISGRLPRTKLQPPLHFTIEVNDSVRRSLGLKVLNLEQIKLQIQKYESELRGGSQAPNQNKSGQIKIKKSRHRTGDQVNKGAA